MIFRFTKLLAKCDRKKAIGPKSDGLEKRRDSRRVYHDDWHQAERFGKIEKMENYPY